MKFGSQKIAIGDVSPEEKTDGTAADVEVKQIVPNSEKTPVAVSAEIKPEIAIDPQDIEKSVRDVLQSGPIEILSESYKDTLPPPPLDSFNANTGNTTNGEILLQWQFPKDVSDISRVEIRSIKGNTAPNSDCASDGEVITTLQTPFNQTSFLHQTNSGLGEAYSYRACLFDTSANSTTSNVSEGVTARFVHNASLQEVSASTGTVQGEIQLTLKYPSDVSGFEKVVVVRVPGNKAPASCTEGTPIYTKSDSFANQTVKDATGNSIGGYFSYLACATSRSGQTSSATAVGVRAFDGIAPPALTSFTASNGGNIAPGSILVSYTFPADVSDYSSVEIKRASGATAPECNGGIRVQRLTQFATGSFLDDTKQPGETFSYRACIYDQSGNVNNSAVALAVKSKLCTTGNLTCNNTEYKQGVCSSDGMSYTFSHVPGKCGLGTVCLPGAETCDPSGSKQVGTCNTSGSGITTPRFVDGKCGYVAPRYDLASYSASAGSGASSITVTTRFPTDVSVFGTVKVLRTESSSTLTQSHCTFSYMLNGSLVTVANYTSGTTGTRTATDSGLVGNATYDYMWCVFDKSGAVKNTYFRNNVRASAPPPPPPRLTTFSGVPGPSGDTFQSGLMTYQRKDVRITIKFPSNTSAYKNLTIQRWRLGLVQCGGAMFSRTVPGPYTANSTRSVTFESAPYADPGYDGIRMTYVACVDNKYVVGSFDASAN